MVSFLLQFDPDIPHIIGVFGILLIYLSMFFKFNFHALINSIILQCFKNLNISHYQLNLCVLTVLIATTIIAIFTLNK